MQTDLDLALAEQKINAKPVEILWSLFLYHKNRKIHVYACLFTHMLYYAQYK